MSHTPGPWMFSSILSGSENHRGWGIWGSPLVPIADVSPLCEGIEDGADPSAQGEANVRLIAAAPELLNALQLVAAHYPHWASHFTEQQIDRDTIGLVRAAIAKAEGK